MLCLALAKEKKAINPRLLDMQGRSTVADYILVCSGSSDTQVKAIADFIGSELKKKGSYAIGIEGEKEGRWVLIDYGDVIVHIFYDTTREFYNIESLWPFAVEVQEETE